MAKLMKIFTKDFRAHRAYFAMLEKRKLRENQILAESMHGVTIDGNIARILEVLTTDDDFSEYVIYLGVGQKLLEQVELFKKSPASETISWSRIKPVLINSREYFEVLATSKYLINDTSFVHSFIKREGQVYLNTWHGTPLKNLGRSLVRERFSMGNVQKNFLASDVILFPNEHTERVICRDYYLDNFCSSHIARTGYPRNEVFFDEKTRIELRKKYAFEEKRVYVYLPTWRGNMGLVEKEQQKAELRKQLQELDERLVAGGHEKDILVYVKLHPMLTDVMDTERYRVIRSYDPAQTSLYAFLQAADGLITDYSSVLFDFALTGRDIILYTYDEEDYIRNHGLYLSMDELPFTRVHTAAELAERILTENFRNPELSDGGLGEAENGNAGENTRENIRKNRYSEFINKFCPYDAPGSTKKLLIDLFSGAYKDYPDVSYNGRDNVLIYGGDFIRNGITVSLLNLLKNLDTEEKNYMVLFEMKEGLAFEPALTEIPEGIAVLGASPVRVQTIAEALRTKVWEKSGVGKYAGKTGSCYRNIGAKEAAKIFGSPYRTDKEPAEAYTETGKDSGELTKPSTGLRIDCALHFTGYSPLYMLALESLPCPRILFVHNDMVREAQKPYAMPSELVADMYCSYDKVALITEGQRTCTENFIRSFGRSIPEKIRENTIKNSLVTVPNVFDYEMVKKRAAEKLVFDEETCSTHTIEQIESILGSGARVLINIGRFSPEKGQLRLIDAFEQAVDGTQPSGEAEKPYLIILGSYGVIYNQLLERVRASKYKDNIIVIRAMRNPYPMLKRCSLFVLSSVYEGLPLTLMEADVLGVPCISTSVGAGPENFMREHGGRLVDDSMEAIRDGIAEYFRGDVPALLNTDYAEMKRESLRKLLEITGDSIRHSSK